MGIVVGSRVAVERLKWPDRPHYRFNEATVIGEDEHGTWLAVPPQPAYVASEVAFIAQSWAALLIPRTGCWWAAFLLGDGAFDIYVDIGTTPEWDDERVWMFDLDLDVVRWMDRGVEIVDRDEFVTNAAAYAYPDALVDEACRAADGVLDAMRRREGPFGPGADRWIAHVSGIASATWFHGSPLKLDVVRAGCTITRDPNVARVFSHKPSLVARDEFKRLSHNGTGPGYLYRVEDVGNDDIYAHPTSTMDAGIEWLTKRDLALTLITETKPIGIELLRAENEAELRVLAKRRSDGLER